jgi:hypothetical protein
MTGTGNVSRAASDGEDPWQLSKFKRTLSSPAQKINSASGFRYRIRLTISPYFWNMERKRKFEQGLDDLGRMRNGPCSQPTGGLRDSFSQRALRWDVCAPSCSPASLGTVCIGTIYNSPISIRSMIFFAQDATGKMEFTHPHSGSLDR